MASTLEHTKWTFKLNTGDEIPAVGLGKAMGGVHIFASNCSHIRVRDMAVTARSGP
jgi:hypothetical protein